MSQPPKPPTGLWLGRVRDVILLLLGTGGFIYESVVPPEPRAILITAYMVMFGLPVFSSFDKLLQRGNQPPSQQQIDPPPPKSDDPASKT